MGAELCVCGMAGGSSGFTTLISLSSLGIVMYFCMFPSFMIRSLLKKRFCYENFNPQTRVLE